MYAKSGRLTKPRLRAGHTVWEVVCVEGRVLVVERLEVSKGLTKNVIAQRPVHLCFCRVLYTQFGKRHSYRSYRDRGIMPQGQTPYNTNRAYKTYNAVIRSLRNLVVLGANIDSIEPEIQRDVLAGLPGFVYESDLPTTTQVEAIDRYLGCCPGTTGSYSGTFSAKAPPYYSQIPRSLLDTDLPTGYYIIRGKERITPPLNSLITSPPYVV